MIVQHMTVMCGFPSNSTVMDDTSQQGWVELSNVSTISLTEANYLMLLNDDGAYWYKPLAHHLRNRMHLYSTFGSVQICHPILKKQSFNMSKLDFDDYCGLPESHADLAKGLTPSTKSASTSLLSQKSQPWNFCVASNATRRITWN
jgi:hypothetical protein